MTQYINIFFPQKIYQGTYVPKPCFATWLFIMDGSAVARKHPGIQAGPGGEEWDMAAQDWNTVLHSTRSYQYIGNVFCLNLKRVVPLWNAFCSFLRLCLGGRAVGNLQILGFAGHALTAFAMPVFAFHLPPMNQNAKISFLFYRERILKRSNIQKWGEVLVFNLLL